MQTDTKKPTLLRSIMVALVVGKDLLSFSTDAVSTAINDQSLPHEKIFYILLETCSCDHIIASRYRFNMTRMTVRGLPIYFLFISLRELQTFRMDKDHEHK
jgi:hypothetical protein